MCEINETKSINIQKYFSIQLFEGFIKDTVHQCKMDERENEKQLQLCV